MNNIYYGYIRVSTAKQGKGVSLVEQKEAINRYALNQRLVISEWFEEKETAAKFGRPVFSSMMKKLKKGNAKGVIIHKIDRGARNLRDWLDLTEDPNIDVHFAHESLNLKDRGGRLSANFQAVVASDYINNLREETIKGIYGRLKQGIYPFNAPVGYLNTGAGNPKSIDSKTGPYIKKAFENYSTGKYTLKTIAVFLNSRGVKNSSGGKFYANNVSLILNNPFYIGIMKIKGCSFRGIHKPLISPKLFAQVQGIMYGKTNQKKHIHEFLFRKLIRCQHCQFNLVGEIQKGNIYYRCHTKGCPTKGLRENYVENLLQKTLSAAQLSDQDCITIDDVLSSMQLDWTNKQKELQQTINLRIAHLEGKLNRLTDAYLDGAIDRNVFEERKEKSFIELRELEDNKQEITTKKELVFIKLKKFLELAKSLTKSFDIPYFEQKRKLVKIVTSNLTARGKNLYIVMHSPFMELANRHFGESGPPDRNTPRKIYTTFIYNAINTSAILGPSITEEEARNLITFFLENPHFLPENLEEDMEG